MLHNLQSHRLTRTQQETLINIFQRDEYHIKANTFNSGPCKKQSLKALLSEIDSFSKLYAFDRDLCYYMTELKERLGNSVAASEKVYFF